jgi:hypothetical protein
VTRKLVRKNLNKLLKQKEDIIKTNPYLSESYTRFLQDFTKYREIEKPQLKKQELRDYLIFGASFQE